MVGAGLAFPGITVPLPETQQNSIVSKLDALKNKFTGRNEANTSESQSKPRESCQGADHLWIHAADKEPKPDALCKCGKVRWSERNIRPVPILNIPPQEIIKGNVHQTPDPL